jgi:hypothetical protein
VEKWQWPAAGAFARASSGFPPQERLTLDIAMMETGVYSPRAGKEARRLQSAHWRKCWTAQEIEGCGSGPSGTRSIIIARNPRWHTCVTGAADYFSDHALTLEQDQRLAAGSCAPLTAHSGKNAVPLICRLLGIILLPLAKQTIVLRSGEGPENFHGQ